MDYEKSAGSSCEQLIFPNKIEANGDVKRISEQELRLLFLEEFKVNYRDLFYSIETPTVKKYRVDNGGNMSLDPKGRSASIDVCIFEREKKGYWRLLNVEFKHENREGSDIKKDMLKLVAEEANGLFIQLLDNTNSGTLRNSGKTGVLDKLHKSLCCFCSKIGNGSNREEYWAREEKYISVVIMSLEEKTLVFRDIKKGDMRCSGLEKIFFQCESHVRLQQMDGKEGWKMKKTG